VERVARETAARVRRGGRIYLFGNGGSAADAIHWSGELMGRFSLDRPGIPAIALATNPAVVTAVANDYDFTQVFARQLDALARSDDVVVAISTSGRSPNVLNALRRVRDRGCFRVGLTGAAGAEMADLVDVLFTVPSPSTPRIQEIHALLGHVICELVEADLYGPEGVRPSV
jgi:D-sedoheptulose 7-phosphate isomerase